MIQLAEDIEYLESRKIPLDPRHKRVFIEVASNRKIDIAILNAEQLKEFDDSETGEDVALDWIENTRNYELEFELPNEKKRFYLLFWNANERGDALVAYKITPLQSP